MDEVYNFGQGIQRDMFPDAYEFFDRFGVYPVDHGFGWIIKEKAGTVTIEQVFSYLNEKTKES